MRGFAVAGDTGKECFGPVDALAGFSAPIAGMVYAHEAILRHFSIKAGGAIAVASITASTVGGSLFAEAGGLKVIGSPPPLLEITPMVLAISPLLGLAAIM